MLLTVNVRYRQREKVADVLKATGTTVANFVRFEVGEGIEKKAELSFVEEVAAAQAAAK